MEDDGDKLICLRTYGGKDIRRLVKHLPTPAAEENDTDFKQAVRKLNAHFIPKKNKQHARYQFNQEKIQAGESIASYLARLREKAEHCQFDDINDRILEHIIQGTKDEAEADPMCLPYLTEGSHFFSNWNKLSGFSEQCGSIRSFYTHI